MTFETLDREADADDEVDADEAIGSELTNHAPGERIARPPLRARWQHLDRSRRIGSRWVQPHTVASYGVLAAVLVLTYRNCRTLQEQGHDWGDDFALYARQAKALVEGNPAQVIADTRFSVVKSGWPFSPNGYPWGWPLLLAPGVLLFGLDYARLKLIPTAMLLLAFMLLHRFTVRRAGHLGALALVVLFATNLFYLGWTNTILSEFAFFASALLSILALDRYRTTGSFLNSARGPAVIAGLSLAWTMNVRREGAGLLLGLLALSAIELWCERRSEARRSLTYRRLLERLARPYIAFVGAAVAFQVILPTDLLPNAGKSSMHNARVNLRIHRLYLAELIGLKDPGDLPLRWYHDVAIGNSVFLVVITLALVGLVLRCIVAPRVDGWVAAGVLAHAYIVLSAPFTEGRYLYALAPWVGYFAVQAIPSAVVAVQRSSTVARPRGAPRTQSLAAARVVAAGALALLAVSNLPSLRNAVAYHRVYSYVEPGPDTPSAVEMFAAVNTRTRPDDVILFVRARAMMLYTDRRTVEGGDLNRLLPIADWYVMAKNSDYGQRLVTMEESASLGLSLEWQNADWIMWRVAHPVTPVLSALVQPVDETKPVDAATATATAPTLP